MCVVPRLCTCSFPPVHEPKLLCNVLDVHGVYVFRDEPGSGDAGAAQGRRHAVPVGPAEEAASSFFTGTGERHAHLWTINRVSIRVPIILEVRISSICLATN